jgi:hypothetical protein
MLLLVILREAAESIKCRLVNYYEETFITYMLRPMLGIGAQKFV